MALFPVSFVEDLKSHADIVQVVQERVPLRRSGAAWKGLCPFHGEKTPSFQVNGDKGVFHCFGCGVGGDVIKFVELYDKITFPEAVRQLAARVGMTVPEAEDSKDRTPTRSAIAMRCSRPTRSRRRGSASSSRRRPAPRPAASCRSAG